MSDSPTRDRRVTNDQRLPVNRAAFEAAFSAKGATDVDSRAQLMQCTRKQVWAYTGGHVHPLLNTAREIACRLDTSVDELWPSPEKAAA